MISWPVRGSQFYSRRTLFSKPVFSTKGNILIFSRFGYFEWSGQAVKFVEEHFFYLASKGILYKHTLLWQLCRRTPTYLPQIRSFTLSTMKLSSRISCSFPDIEGWDDALNSSKGSLCSSILHSKQHDDVVPNPNNVLAFLREEKLV